MMGLLKRLLGKAIRGQVALPPLVVVGLAALIVVAMMPALNIAIMGGDWSVGGATIYLNRNGYTVTDPAGTVYVDDLLPNADSTWDIGAVGNEFAEGHFDTAFVGGTEVVRSATFVIAANDSLATSKAQADYVCDGVADQEEINAAVALLVSNTIGGTIQLTEGYFYTTDSIVLDKPVMLVGQGVNSTYLSASHAANAAIQFDYNVVIAFGAVKDMRIIGAGGGTGAGIHIVTGNSPDIELGRLWISSCGGAAIDIDGGWDHNLHNIVAEGNVGIGLDLGTSNAFITDCSFHNNFNGVVMGLGSQAIITGGQISRSEQHNLIATSPYWLVIQGAKIYDAGGKTPTLDTYDGIVLTTDGVNGIRSVVIANIPLLGEFGVAGAQRYGIRVDRNGVDLATSFINIDGVHFLNNATGDIRLDTSLNLSNVRIRNVDGPWSVFDNSAFLNETQISAGGAWSTAHVNGGGDFFPMTRFQVNTSVNINSRGMVYCEAAGFQNEASFSFINWDKAMRVTFGITRHITDAQVVARVQLKEVAAEGALAAKGIGIRIDNYDLVAESYGTALGTTSLATTITNIRPYTIDIILIPGTDKHIMYAVNNVIMVIEDTANNVPSGNAGNVSYFVFSIINGGAGGVDALAYMFFTRVLQER